MSQLHKEFKQHFGFDLQNVLIEFTPRRYIFNAKEFLRLAFDEHTATYFFDTVPNLVLRDYGEEAQQCILQVREAYK